MIFRDQHQEEKLREFFEFFGECISSVKTGLLNPIYCIFFSDYYVDHNYLLPRSVPAEILNAYFISMYGILCRVIDRFICKNPLCRRERLSNFYPVFKFFERNESLATC